jgi:hypothetical protein
MLCRLDILNLYVSVLLHIAIYGDKKSKKICDYFRTTTE